jgi:hypothetical protein
MRPLELESPLSVALALIDYLLHLFAFASCLGCRAHQLHDKLGGIQYYYRALLVSNEASNSLFRSEIAPPKSEEHPRDIKEGHLRIAAAYHWVIEKNCAYRRPRYLKAERHILRKASFIP